MPNTPPPPGFTVSVDALRALHRMNTSSVRAVIYLEDEDGPIAGVRLQGQVQVSIEQNFNYDEEIQPGGYLAARYSLRPQPAAMVTITGALRAITDGTE